MTTYFTASYDFQLHCYILIGMIKSSSSHDPAMYVPDTVEEIVFGVITHFTP